MYQKALCALEVGFSPRGFDLPPSTRVALFFVLDHCIEAPHVAEETGGEFDSDNGEFGNTCAADYKNDNAKT